MVTESVCCDGDGHDPSGFLYIISTFGVPTACINLPGVPQSICFVDDKILLALADSKIVYFLEAGELL